MDRTKPIIKIGMPVVTNPITTTVIISAGRRAQAGLKALRRALSAMRHTKKNPTAIGKNDHVISEDPRTQIA
jgi:hypothetical protein